MKSGLWKTAGSILWLALKIFIIVYALYYAVNVPVLYQGF